MMSADNAISRFRRDMAMGLVVKLLLIAALIIFLVVPQSLGWAKDTVALLLLLIWVFLAYKSTRGSRLSATSPMLIATGQFEQAELQIDQALRSFSIFGRMKLLALHHLALLRHAQRRWGDTTELCHVILKQRWSARGLVSRPTRLLLADSLLELGDVEAAGRQIEQVRRYRLNLQEMTTFLLIELDYQQRIHAWNGMMDHVASKVELAETMTVPAAGRVQALMALAAARLHQTQWRDWLSARAQLLEDTGDLITWRPVLGELWPDHANHVADESRSLPEEGDHAEV